MRQLATIRTISQIRPIPGADRIVVAQVDGWECVVQKDEFNVGDEVIYIEVDSIMPEKPEFEFLRNRKFRVRAIKLRGQVSYGLVLKKDILPPGKYPVGTDVTKILGVTKYDPQAAEEEKLAKTNGAKKQSGFAKYLMRFGWFRKRFAPKTGALPFPSWIQKTDEERIQNLPDLFERERDNCTSFSVTEKIDGQSGTFFLRKVGRKYEFGVCSRNRQLLEDDSSYWQVARMYNIKDVLRKLIGNHKWIVLQGEVIGPGIQKNKYRLDHYDLLAFNLIYPEYKCSTYMIRQKLSQVSDISTVPLVESNWVLPETIAEAVEYSKGKSLWYPKQRREGVVVRNVTRDISFKIINPDFLLADED